MWKLITLFIVFPYLGLNASCPSGWMRHENSCYHFSHDQEDWPNAMTMCHVLGGKLVEIESSSENAFLVTMAKRFNKNYYIGLSDIQEEGVWMWMESKIPLAQTGFSFWYSGEPSNGAQNENCVTLDGLSRNGHWNDVPCKNDAEQYICEKQDGDQEIVG